MVGHDQNTLRRHGEMSINSWDWIRPLMYEYFLLNRKIT